MNRAALASAALLSFVSMNVPARGVSPYLPLNLEPEMEHQIERVLILADKPVMTRPIATATVLDALPKACAVDPVLCSQVRRYLARFMRTAGIAHASIEGASTSGSGSGSIAPNTYGMTEGSHWDASLLTYYQPSDYALVSLGGIGYAGRTNPTGSMVSLGWEWTQLDVGYRAHWLSPFTDSSMLMSSEAPTRPSVTVSNYTPMTSLGLSYQLFASRETHSDRIVWKDGYTSGEPTIGGFQLALEPASGWSLAFNRIVQFGGGARGSGSLSQLLKALFNPSRYSNTSAANSNQDAANQEASVTSSLLFPGRVPFAVYVEYAGEDTSRGRNYLLGNTALSWGIHFPSLFRRFDLTVEVTEWQNAWYVNSIYEDGLTNYGLVVGNWFGDQRVFNDGVGGRSAMARLGWDPWFGGKAEVRFRTLENQSYGVISYERFHELTLDYSRPLHGVVIGGEVTAGKDVFGGSFTRIAAFMRLGDDGAGSSGDYDGETPASDPRTQLLVDAGVNSLRVKADVTETAPKTTGPTTTGAHLALGARRAVSDHSDLGARVEYDELSGTSLLGARLIDYRYRFSNPLALGVFLGAARYALDTPAYGFYYGIGLQWRDLLPHVDFGVEGRYYDSLARDHVLPSDPHTTRPDSFYDVSGAVLSLTYHF